MRTGRVVVALVAATVLTGCTAPSPRPARPLSWRACPGHPIGPVRCTTITVPLDWAHPDGRRITLALSRLPATDPKHRIGTLLFNPGGPGVPGASQVADRGVREFEPALRRRFDIVGFDPRGAGRSTPLRCAGQPLPVGRRAYPTDAASFAALRRQSAAYAASCATHSPPDLLRHVDTPASARDVDAIRAALGQPTISFLGVSYGSFLGATYARLFPRRVRALVLDGAVDHAAGPIPFLLQESAAVEDAFGRFAAWCARTAGCALHGRDVVAVWDRTLARFAGTPTGDAIRLSLPYLLLFGATGVLHTGSWSALAAGLAAAERGHPDVLTRFSAVGDIDPDYVATGCLDLPPRLTGWADVRDRLRRARAVAPHTGGAGETWLLTVACAGWPIPATDPWADRAVTGIPPSLVVSTRHDPSTPLPWAYALHRQVHGSRLLLADTVGHSGFASSRCARAREADYLLTRRIPALDCS